LTDKKEEELRKIIELPEALKRVGGDPFAVDVEDLLRKINENRLKDRVRSLKYESEALNAVSLVIEKQEQWVLDALKGLKIDPELIREKMREMPLRDLAMLLARHVTPVLGIRRLSAERLRMAMEYLSLTEPWGRKPKLGMVNKAQEEYVQSITFDKKFEEEAMEFYENSLRKELESAGRIPYREFINRFSERLKVAFYIAYLATIGMISVVRNPLTGETLISRPLGGEFESVAIPFE